MGLDEIIKNYGLDTLNSFSKYPSILTYHSLADKGSLAQYLSEDKSFSEDIFITEKIDGANSRIVFFNNDYLIGSREEFLYAKGDRIMPSTLSIVPTLKPIADKISPLLASDQFYVLYGETYGGNVTAASKQYTVDKSCAFRAFDLINMSLDEVKNILGLGMSKISSWRDHGGQLFVDTASLNTFLEKYSIDSVPHLIEMKGLDFPTTLKETFEWLKQFKSSKAGINHSGVSEGVVVRNKSRNLIRKIRFEDYERTQKRGGF